MTPSESPFGPISEFMRDPSIADVMINGTNPVYIERNGQLTRTDVRFESERQVLEFIEKLFASSGKRVDTANPFVDVCLEDGSRAHAVIPPVSRIGPVLTIRKSPRGISTVEHLVELDTVSPQAAQLLVACIQGRLNILFSGGTGTGKTTTLKVLSNYIAPHERIICIEDTAELNLKHEHVISLETRQANLEGRGEVGLHDLIRNALRMRPDRIIVGEIRDIEALDLLQAMSVGHTGCLSVVHGNSPSHVIARLETMILRTASNMSPIEVRRQIASTIHLIVHQDRLSDGSRRVVYITEVEGFRHDGVVLHDLFTFELAGVDAEGKIGGELKATYKRYPAFVEKFRRMGIKLDKAFTGR
jgi:pilus assembly protein CpaF